MKNFAGRFQKAIQPRRMKICLGIPCTGTVRVETLLTVVGILTSSPHDFYVDYRTGCYIEENRTSLILTAMRENCEKLFFLDADMEVEPQVVNKLLALNKPVVGAAYNNRTPEIEQLPNGERNVVIYSNVKIADENGNLIRVPSKDIPKAPFRCAGVPTGCMLIDIAAVRKLPMPWFDLTYFEDGKLNLGEDIFFCRKMIECGFEVWCDPTIQTKHIGTFPY